MSKTTFKKDRFQKTRGGHSRWLQLSCEKCKYNLFVYQKDGPGILKRIYIDRIRTNKALSAKNLTCPSCHTILGIAMVYKKEQRAAYRLFVGAVTRKTITDSQI